jgi:hypothetical protein
MASADKSMVVIEGANHYFAGQPDKLVAAATAVRTWLRDRGLLDA